MMGMFRSSNNRDKAIEDEGEISISLNDEGSIRNNHADAKLSPKDKDSATGEDFENSASCSNSSFLQNSKFSSDSFDISINYGEDSAVFNSNRLNTKKPMEKEHLVFRWILLGLLSIAVILSALSSMNYRATSCAFANIVVLGIIGIVFVVYDFRMKRREESLIKTVNRSESIVNSLFPEIVRDRILEEGTLEGPKRLKSFRISSAEPSSAGNKNLLPFATTNGDEKIRDETNGKDTSFKSNCISEISMDDPMRKNMRQKSIPSNISPICPSSSSLPRQRRRKSNQSTASSSDTIFSDTNGSGDTDLDLYKPRKLYAPNNSRSTKPIADYFPSATIMFADIVGFTSWASTREPVQVFELLETVYRRFDRIAKKKGVFKVETIGDCYVAATGLPNAMNDHALAMASFSRRCLESMLDTVADLEESLGPGTADLGLRIGIHSGSVIGGVLRGAKSRYQLFGDTMNTASRIESSSLKNKIQLSSETAEILMEAGKAPWVQPRGKTIFAKGKGELKTYWLTTEGPKNLSAKEAKALPAILKMMAKANIDPGFIQKKKPTDPNEKRERLVDYHTNVLKGLLSRLANMRSARNSDSPDTDIFVKKLERLVSGDESEKALTTELILFPTCANEDTIASAFAVDISQHTIDDSVSDQLREMTSKISKWHSDDLPFHTFEHASHTVLSITKLLAAIETTDLSTDTVLFKTKSMITHPLTQFVLVFAALVHDSGRTEDTPMKRLEAAEKSNQRAWSLFMEPSFIDLRRTICRSRHDFEFFRRLLKKSILVASGADTGPVGDRSNGGSSRSLSSKKISSFAENQEASLKALSIVVKVLRVSNISYALHHFLVFQKWNKLLFEEAYQAYQSKSNDHGENKDVDPSSSWYERELESFGDRIRLVTELRDSGVCNKLADVYLSAAIANRREWERRGKPIVDEYLDNDYSLQRRRASN